jgi:hypothetical protein
MTKICITYPTGQGGNWLSNLMYSLETNNFDIVPTSKNFHKYPKSNQIYFSHENNPQGMVVGSFASFKSQFVTYLNAYYKSYTTEGSMANLKNAELLYALSNNARWRMETNGQFFQDYLDNIIIDADLMFDNPTIFAQQVFACLDRYKVKHTPNTRFVLESIDNYKKSCWTLDRIDITNNIPWLAWCHAICTLKNIKIPFLVKENFDKACKWLMSEQQYFLTETNKQFITKL